MYILFTHNRYFFCVDSSLDIPIFFSRCKHPRTNPIRQPLTLNRLRLCISFFFWLDATSQGRWLLPLAPRRFFCPRIAVMPCRHGPSESPQAMSSTSPWSKVIWYLGGRSTGGMFKWWFTMVWLIIIRTNSKYEHEITWLLEVTTSDSV